MNLHDFVFRRFRSVGWLGRFLLVTGVAATFNFAEIFFQTMKASNAAGTHVVDGYQITVCYFGPPAPFYPRLLISCSLVIAILSISRRSFPINAMTIIGSIGALVVYVYWWISSYRVFRNLSEAGVAFLHNPQVKQTAYLYGGTSADVAIAASVLVCVVLLVERFINLGRHTS